ncbi:MAG: Gfo/Idh/MocA family oxidoreductase [Nitrososphaerota archaeon]
MSRNKLFGVGIAGCGWVSTQYVPAFEKNPYTKVVALMSPRIASCENLARECGLKDVKFYTDYSKLVDDPNVNIITICSPQHLHVEQAVMAAEAKKHMVVEKPIAISLEQLKMLRDSVRKSRVKTVVGFVLRWNPLFETIKSLLVEGALGDVYYVETGYNSHIADWWTGWHWAKTKEYGVSSFLVAGVHALDAARWLSCKAADKANNITEVFAYSGGHRYGKDIEYYGLEVLLAKFENGALGKINSNFDCASPYYFPVTIFGDKGTIVNNRIWAPGKFPGQTDWVTVPTILPDTADVRHHPFEHEVNHFVDCILKDKESHCNVEDAVNTHEAALAAIISYNENRPVKLPLIK